MKKFRTSLIAAATAGAVALTAAPAMAEEDNGGGSSNLSSQVGDALNATESERDAFGSSKNLSSEEGESGEFTDLWYGASLSAAATIIGGVAYLVYPAVQDGAATFGIHLPDRAPLPFD